MLERANDMRCRATRKRFLIVSQLVRVSEGELVSSEGKRERNCRPLLITDPVCTHS